MRRILLIIGLILSCWSPARADNLITLHYAPAGPIYDYRWQVLALALAHTTDEGPVHMLPLADAPVSQLRLEALVQQHELDVVCFSSTPEREATLRPIRVDILRGMLGYRILLIRDSDQARFNRLDDNTLRQQVTLGFNNQWADYPILTGNHFHVMGTVGYDSLFAMLSAGRFDAFPRGLNEVGPELAVYQPKYPNIAEEKSLALFVNYPVYFWVRRDNAVLATRIERGLKLAMADGSFKALFLHTHAEEIDKVRREHRRVVYLTNPQLPPGTPPADTSWWWHSH
ncbi:MAG: hypothetical protein JO171_11640 [Paludibacterium sp.]|uniref:hypothetical protein n=1 Tax=Paludibacterium sp. TaxID=1917523 RepID=UPI0025ED2927|nr:hypothetical protein [Paludibacterium sp.]MBV8047801.1 hypothetical protein [Paludibacterium sp.]MBV8646671.1 hypothetical protein [Paludibacterium sp.]